MSLISERTKKVKPSVRMKPAVTFINEGDFSLPRGKFRSPAYLSKIWRKHKGKPFIMKRKYKKMKKGLWVMTRKKARRLQSFEPKAKKIKKNPWLARSHDNFFLKADLDALWVEAMDYLFKDRKFK